MRERSIPIDLYPIVERDNSVVENALLLGGEKAAPKIIERILDLKETKRIIVFGEPGANKTTLMLQLASELVRLSPAVEPTFVFYDDALDKVKKDKGIANLSNNKDYDLVSEELSREMDETFPQQRSDTEWPIQFVELVGISAKNRGTSSLIEAADRIKDQGPMTQDTFFIAIAADVRSLKAAGETRAAIAQIKNELDIFDVLKAHNIHLAGYPKNISARELAKRLKDFFGKMASEERIDLVHREVVSQIKQNSAQDDDRLFKMLKLPELPYPIETIEAKQNYLWNAAFLQSYLYQLGLTRDMFDTSFKITDKGLVIFSPYNPDIPKVIDLSKVLLDK